jgi:hypothetical protein
MAHGETEFLASVAGGEAVFVAHSALEVAGLPLA